LETAQGHIRRRRRTGGEGRCNDAEEASKQVDFLSGIVGLDTKDVRKRAPAITLADGVMV
jgi:hypothetical protein